MPPSMHLRARVHLRRQLRRLSMIIQGQLHKGQAEPWSDRQEEKGPARALYTVPVRTARQSGA